MNHTDHDRFSLILAALLHDVGKIGQRAFARYPEGLSADSKGLESQACPTDRHSGKPGYLHVLYTNEFFLNGIAPNQLPDAFDLTLAINAATYHHKPQHSLDQIVQEADHLSSGMERSSVSAPEWSGAPRSFRDVRLASIMDKIEIDLEARTGPPAHHALISIDTGMSEVFPSQTQQNNNGRYLDLWNGLISSFESNKVLDPLGWLDRALSNLETWSWCVPSATNEPIPDVSLFDHLKTTAAIAACLYDSRNADPEHPFLLVKGDFGGIQNFIFDLHAGAGGLAKRLRGRSFYVAIFTELVALSILRRFQLPLTNRLLGAGGNFLLLLPNRPDVIEELDKIQMQMDEWSSKETSGEIRLHLGRYNHFKKNQLADFTSILEGVNASLAAAKARPMASRLLISANGGWSDVAPLGPVRPLAPTERVCDSCQKNFAEPAMDEKRGREVAVCAACKAQQQDGRLLTKRSWIALGPPDAGFDGRRLPSIGQYRILDLLNDEAPGAWAVYSFDSDPAASHERLPLVRWLHARHIPLEPGEDVQAEKGADFEYIANQSCDGHGDGLLGWLKADVDYLGLVFERGLSREGDPPQRRSVSRLATLSRMMDWFFTGWLQEDIEENWPNLYIVYAGGDDLLITGPWDQVLDFAAHLRQRFSVWTGANPNLGLSAGMALCPPKRPVLKAVAAAEAALDLSKEPDDGGRKNRITALGSTLEWEQFSDAITQARHLAEWIEAGAVGRTAVHRLRRYAAMWESWRRTGDNRFLRYIPMLVWDIKRNWTASDRDPLLAEKNAALAWAHQLTNPDDETVPPVISFTTQYALHATRRRKNKEENGNG